MDLLSGLKRQRELCLPVFIVTKASGVEQTSGDSHRNSNCAPPRGGHRVMFQSILKLKALTGGQGRSVNDVQSLLFGH